MKSSELQSILEFYYLKYNQKGFVENDPISIPHRFSKKQDIEIAGFFAAIFSWGQRVTIINKCNELMHLMGEQPHDFILNHHPQDLRPFESFKHRTFNSTDLLYFIAFLQHYYQKNNSLETAFGKSGEAMKTRLSNFNNLFFSLPEVPNRTRKHIASPMNKSTCKRLNMYLRWMVRKDENGVDLGIWNTIQMSELHCPLDVHVERTARKLGLIHRKQSDWETVEELTNNLKILNPSDPIRYDFALFGMGLEHYEIN
jgi:uncharacterized protein (TIGR02757 family)